MKAYLIISSFLFIVGFTNCSTTKHLPNADKVHEYPYGSYISCKVAKDYTPVEGELLALDEEMLYVLTQKNDVKEVNLDSVSSFRLHYAKGKPYNWFYTMLPISATHGFAGIFSLPFNFVTITTVAASANRQFSFNGKKLSVRELSTFARFPQGLPEEYSPPEKVNSFPYYRE